MYPLVRSVRLIEALGEYRKNVLPLSRYLYAKNFALGYFIPDLVSMILRPGSSGLGYIRPWRLVQANFLYPNFYLSFFKYFLRKLSAKMMGTQQWQTASTK